MAAITSARAFCSAPEGGAEALRHHPCMGAVALGEAVEVGAGAEELAAVAGDDDGAHARVGIERADQRAQLFQPLGGEGVGGRALEGEAGDVPVDDVLDHAARSVSR